ncbi:5-oxoprolinase subunit PxpB [Schinkia azotoformans]|uniref:Allophanate hydrolase subunit 1 n=1 Tax=Schinkia azotoformans LMG 9581 TaxID=1131731 RepID=K6D8A1_SCHAZ|nr:5-oxoprolinase subunit PxpB [Schinkia azotoformans]EKN64323.1 allophanate hydrolase subunit 1 [Schinkia azotoformans LMG 9581]MEC1637968.1 5-oxoprolinase subunit PxpB [Schinkia azotoformans]MEC1721522.1 5-oxoprolinase subunit PxpB [Schinkia azotoformans]MEC1944865.1 5-oxoprolinase subunit PxpB [Schinkia azotoformans]MED4352131.1 5-oxoprolinase subunit PxpB [Schinkia azotoformans]
MTIHDKIELIRPLGDSALVIHLGDGINPTIHEQVKHLSYLIEKEPFPGFIESVPSYNNLTVYYNPAAVYFSIIEKDKKSPYKIVSALMAELLDQLSTNELVEERLVKIPVAYGGEFGPDLEYVAAYHGLTVDEVIQIHSANDCQVYMIGFAPGFPFLGGMDERIATPRKESPRLAIAPGSVGIAGKQTGVYPLETPGGWQIIGRTPLDLFLPEQTPPTLLQSGDKIRFIPISFEEFATYKEMKHDEC